MFSCGSDVHFRTVSNVRRNLTGRSCQSLSALLLTDLPALSLTCSQSARATSEKRWNAVFRIVRYQHSAVMTLKKMWSFLFMNIIPRVEFFSLHIEKLTNSNVSVASLSCVQLLLICLISACAMSRCIPRSSWSFEMCLATLSSVFSVKITGTVNVATLRQWHYF